MQHAPPPQRALHADLGAGAAAAAQPGLSNATGEYNCFLNAIIQCLWQCQGFRAGLLGADMAALSGDGTEGALPRTLLTCQIVAFNWQLLWNATFRRRGMRCFDQVATCIAGT